MSVVTCAFCLSSERNLFFIDERPFQFIYSLFGVNDGKYLKYLQTEGRLRACWVCQARLCSCASFVSTAQRSIRLLRSYLCSAHEPPPRPLHSLCVTKLELVDIAPQAESPGCDEAPRASAEPVFFKVGDELKNDIKVEDLPDEYYSDVDLDQVQETETSETVKKSYDEQDLTLSQSTLSTSLQTDFDFKYTYDGPFIDDSSCPPRIKQESDPSPRCENQEPDQSPCSIKLESDIEITVEPLIRAKSLTAIDHDEYSQTSCRIEQEAVVETYDEPLLYMKLEDGLPNIPTDPLSEATQNVVIQPLLQSLEATVQNSDLVQSYQTPEPLAKQPSVTKLTKSAPEQTQLTTDQKKESRGPVTRLKMDSDDDICTPPDILELATKVTHNLLPEKSRKLYEKEYNNFLAWKIEKKTTSFSENVILAYLKDLSDKFKPSSMWAKYSMLKSTLSIYNNIDITKYTKVIAFLKRSSEGHKEKKSLTFTSGQIKMFLENSPDILYLFEKVALIFGIMGACRRQELYNIQFDEVSNIDDSTIMVKVSKTKTKIDRSFVVTGNCYAVCKKYMELRPTPCRNPAFFLSYRSGKCVDQRTGINKFGALGKTIANFLNLPNPALYTGHCFRRTSATLIIDSGGDLTETTRGLEVFYCG